MTEILAEGSAGINSEVRSVNRITIAPKGRPFRARRSCGGAKLTVAMATQMRKRGGTRVWQTPNVTKL